MHFYNTQTTTNNNMANRWRTAVKDRHRGAIFLLLSIVAIQVINCAPHPAASPQLAPHAASPSPSAAANLQFASHQQQQQQLFNINNNNNNNMQTITATTTTTINSNPYTTATHLLLLDLRQQMLTRALKFDEHFRQLLTQSKLSLHNTFINTYGNLYERNTEIFTSFYESLEQYYATGRLKLTKSMENFFEHLYQKAFQVFNNNRAFSPSYLECATQTLVHLKPFKDVPDKLIEEIKHVFVAARTFNQVLNSGIDIIKSVISLGQPSQCLNLINEKLIRHNGVAPGNKLPPCLGYCEQVMIRCVGRTNLEQLSDKWKIYVLSIGELAKKLSIHYNIETIIAPLDVQISEAIMNFQENAQNISHQVFQACGRADSSGADDQVTSGLSQIKPIQNRLGKRAASPVSVSQSTRRGQHSSNPGHQGGDEQFLSSLYNYNNNNNNNNQQQQQLTAQTRGITGQRAISRADNSNKLESNRPSPSATNFGGHELEDLVAPPAGKRSPVIIDEIKDFMLSTRPFWSNLPNSICTSNQTLASALGHQSSNNAMVIKRQQQQQSAASATTAAAGQCFQEPLGLSDMNTDLRFRTEIQQLVNRLDLMHSKIISALNGNEIDSSQDQQQQQQQQLVSQQQQQANLLRPQFNNRQLPLLPAAGGRSGQPTTSTTTTTTTPFPEPSIDDDTSEDGGDIDESGSGSTEPPEDSLGDSDEESDPLPGSTEGIEGNPTDDSDDEDTAMNSDLTPTAPESDMVNQNRLPDDQIIDPAQKPEINLDISNELITPPDQSAQRASSSRSKLVITNQIQSLLAFLLFVALSIVTNCHTTTTTRRGGQILVLIHH